MTIPEDTDNGRYYVTAYDVAEDDSVSHMFNVTDVTLTISPESIDLEEFHEGGQGVTLTVEDLEPGTEVDFQVAQEYADTELGGRATADSDGKAVLTVNAPTSSNYLGNYYVTVMDVEHHVEVARGTFEVTSDKPQIVLPETEVYQGESLAVQIYNLTPNGDVEIEWNPTETFTADGTGFLAEDLAIADDAETGVQTLTVTDVESEESNSVEYTVLEADVVEPALTIDPEEITLEDFVGDPDDGAGVTHVVEGLEPGAEITYTVTGPEGVNDFEQTRSVDENGVLEFVIHGFEGPNPEVYLGEYTTVVTFVNEDGETEQLTGSFSVVTGEDDEAGTDEDDDAAEPVADTSADINGTDLAQTGATSGQLALIAGGLLLLGGAFVVFANRARLFGRKH